MNGCFSSVVLKFSMYWNHWRVCILVTYGNEKNYPKTHLLEGIGFYYSVQFL